MSDEQEICGQCGHAFAPHLVIATTGDPKRGGIALCQVKGCPCQTTWSVPQLGSERADVFVPNPEAVDKLRAELQTEDAS